MSSCALSAGDPWSSLEVGLAVETEIPPERLDEESRIRAANDYRIVLERFSGEVEGVTVRLRDGSDNISFDPASPPPGYGLCHAGHCHADDGALVPYEEIEAELSGGGSAGSEVLFAYESPFELGANEQLVLPAVCPTSAGSQCDMDRGSTEAFEIELRNLRMTGVAHDSRTGSNARIPDEGIAFDHELPGPITLRANYHTRFDRGEEVVHTLMLLATLGADAYDGVDWSLDESDMAAALNEGLADALTLAVISNP